MFLKGNLSRAQLEKWIPVFVALIALLGNLAQVLYPRLAGTEQSAQSFINVTRYGPVTNPDGQRKFIFAISQSNPLDAPNIVPSKQVRDGGFWFGLRKKVVGDPQDIVLAGGPVKLTTARNMELDLPSELAVAYFDRCDSVGLIGLLLLARSRRSEREFNLGAKIAINEWANEIGIPFAVSNNRCN